jgi:hypothetical protein
MYLICTIACFDAVLMQVSASHQLIIQVSHAVRPSSAVSAAEPITKKAKKPKHEGSVVNGQDAAAPAADAAVTSVELDTMAALEDMHAMGAGLVEDIWQKGPGA